MMFTLFDHLSAHLRKIKKPQTHRDWYLIVLAWQIKKGLNLGLTEDKQTLLLYNDGPCKTMVYDASKVF